jgi:hypothetical protein
VRILFALLIACAAPVEVFAQSPKMDSAFSVKSKPIEIEVEIDQRLRDYKRLYASILNEAKGMVAARRTEAETSWRKERVMFQLGPWAYERGYYFEAEAGPYVSVSVLDYSFTGGAHPNQRTTAILWNREHGRRTNIAELFKETNTGGPTLSALAALLREEVAKEKRERDIPVAMPLEKDEWISAIKPDLKTMGAPSLVRSSVGGKAAGIDFHFSAYDVGSYAEGAFGGYLNWQTLAPFLTDKAKQWFAGDRADLLSEPSKTDAP